MPLFWVPAISGVTEEFSPECPGASVLLGAEGGLGDALSTHNLHLCGPCSSVLDVAMHLAQSGRLMVWDSVLASSQWAGRGQLRRSWISEPGNLFTAWRLPVPPPAWGGLLSVLAGWVLCTALREGGVEAQVKWPNDILVAGRKVGGILLEEREDILLAGVGLNLVSHPEERDLRKDRACPAGALTDLWPGEPLFRRWLRLVNSAQLRYRAALSESTPAEFSRSIEPMLAYLGTAVHVGDHRSLVRGLYMGLCPDGGIVLRTDEGKRVLHSGSLGPEE